MGSRGIITTSKMKVKAFELKNKTSKELLKEVDELKSELGQLRVAKATGAAAPKLAKIRIIRKNIARVYTVYNQKMKAEARGMYAGKKYTPQDLRPKKTRAIRRALTGKQQGALTHRELVRKQNFGQRKFALKA